jgi:hypothetical protein
MDISKHNESKCQAINGLPNIYYRTLRIKSMLTGRGVGGRTEGTGAEYVYSLPHNFPIKINQIAIKRYRCVKKPDMRHVYSSLEI